MSAAIAASAVQLLLARLSPIPIDATTITAGEMLE
jgi:hypothetical protein